MALFKGYIHFVSLTERLVRAAHSVVLLPILRSSYYANYDVDRCVWLRTVDHSLVAVRDSHWNWVSWTCDCRRLAPFRGNAR